MELNNQLVEQLKISLNENYFENPISPSTYWWNVHVSDGAGLHCNISNRRLLLQFKNQQKMLSMSIRFFIYNHCNFLPHARMLAEESQNFLPYLKKKCLECFLE